MSDYRKNPRYRKLETPAMQDRPRCPWCDRTLGPSFITLENVELTGAARHEME